MRKNKRRCWWKLHWSNTRGGLLPAEAWFDSRGCYEWILKLPELIQEKDKMYIYCWMKEFQLKEKSNVAVQPCHSYFARIYSMTKNIMNWLAKYSCKALSI